MQEQYTFNIPAGMSGQVVFQADAQMPHTAESPEQRVMRLHAVSGGALLGWLLDECERKGHTQREMASELGVTYGYVHQLRNGLRQTRHISPEMTSACARYLGVPPVVVKLLSGSLSVRDFAWPHQTESELLDRGLHQIRTDPVARALLPADAENLPTDVKRSLVLLYGESSGQEVLGVRCLPNVLQWLQRAAVVHEDNQLRATA
jgi:transcriptional regulator with XRE-family HTH domain